MPSHLTPGPDHLALTARNADGKRQIYLLDKSGAPPKEKTSLARGHSIHSLTWAASDLRLDTDSQGAAQSVDPTLCCDGFNVYVIWLDNRNGQDEVFFNGSSQ